MGENEVWADPGGPLPNGLLPGAGPVMQALDSDRWMRAEERTAELIDCIQPNPPSEERRNAVADYVQRLIMKCFPCQVCTFGSVPLKTYLPDGDIDLTAFSHDLTLKDTWANHVLDMLQNEEKNENAEFHVKEVQYIQADVKIIKCLVENIVVDISFNQVGGLCTLCFLVEVDNLINQNHLFKRSIILIKAWCYYESRILGAHHGLISTYALETLVLYIFHVFNNTFHGPLEVLYRFLEFFSNFDWDNFCVSLWGPVPISSLPDITAEPPRKDGGELLLSKVFLNACSNTYAVFQSGQENNGQPFVSKHFNVIDPLRVNNNLGRSVSKGNFYRIRSAFAFGAKRLARLLDCQTENIVLEVNQFFMNTWERHGSGHRPDAREIDSSRTRLSTPDGRHEFGNSSNNTSGNNGNQNSHVQSLKSQNLNSMPVTDQSGRRENPADGVQRGMESDHLVNDTQGRFLFARTRSSPELTDAYGNVSSRVQRNTEAEAANARATPTSSSLKHVPPQQSLDAASDSISGLNSYHLDLRLDGSSEELLSTSAAQVMYQQEEQDMVNMMASASLQGFNGQFPFNLNLGHLPFSIPPSFFASMGYNQRNHPGFLPPNIPFIDPQFSNMQFPHGLVQPQMAHYFPGTEINAPSEASDRNNENSEELDKNFWQEQDANSSPSCDPERGNFDIPQSADKPLQQASGSKYVPPPRVSTSGSAKKHTREKRGSARKNGDSFPIQDDRRSEVQAEERSANSRFSSATRSNSWRSRTSSESSWDGSSVKTPKSTKEKWGRKIVSTDLATSHGKGKVMSEHVSNQAEEDDQEWGSLSNTGTEIVERNNIPGFEIAQTSGSDSTIAYPPMLIRPGSRQRTDDNSELITFYPTGPPIPFLTMLPLYNTSDASSGHFGGEEILESSEYDASEDLNPSSSLRGTTPTETSEKKKTDILNSDFISHYQNLEFGRRCLNPQYHGPVVYPSASPVMVPPVYLQGRSPYDTPGRPFPANTNLFSQLMTNYGQRMVPVAPIQSVSGRPPNMYQSYVDDMPRYRSGTGTYLPNPKVFVRDRHASGTRRGNYNHERTDNYSDREGNWNANSKQRTAARSYNSRSSQTDKSNSRADRASSSESRTDRSYRQESIPSYQSHNSPSSSNPSQNGPQNVAYSMYPFAATNPGGVSNGPSVPPVMMFYPFDHNNAANYGSQSDQLEFGSLGQAGLPGGDEQLQLNEGNRARVLENHRLSPDQPSSPHHQSRRV
ncbi:hypothetical protein ABFX02_14G138200 [Erythranthe guttata]